MALLYHLKKKTHSFEDSEIPFLCCSFYKVHWPSRSASANQGSFVVGNTEL